MATINDFLLQYIITLLNFLVYLAINTIYVILISPFLLTFIKKIKAFTQKRRGPPWFQGYYNLIKLFRKETVYSSTSSIIMRITPILNLTIMIVASLSVPILFVPDLLNTFGNVILLIYLLAVTKFFLALSGLDAGSTFGGLGSSREMTVLAVFEPIIILVFVALVFILGTTDIFEMFSISVSCSNNILTSSPACHYSFPLLIPIAISLFVMLIVETARIPVDNPETQLELTMIHEAMILEQSGPNLAMLELSHGIKQTILMSILINIIFPFGLALTLTPINLFFSLIMFTLKIIFLSALVVIFDYYIEKFILISLHTLFSIALFLPVIVIGLSVFT